MRSQLSFEPHPFNKKMLHLGDATFWKSCDLDLTLKGYPMSIVLR